MVTKRTVTCSAYYIWQIPAAILDGSLLMAEWRLKIHFGWVCQFMQLTELTRKRILYQIPCFPGWDYILQSGTQFPKVGLGLPTMMNDYRRGVAAVNGCRQNNHNRS
jgi:hypothetical protein